MSIAYSSQKRTDINLDTSQVRYKVVICKELGDTPIQLRLKTAGDPHEPGSYKIGMDLADYLREVWLELRLQHYYLRVVPLHWINAASEAVIYKAKRMSVHL